MAQGGGIALAGQCTRTHDARVVATWRSINRDLWAICLACLVRCGVAAQETVTPDSEVTVSPFVCRAWRVEEGLPHNTVTAIAQTRDGYLWIGTANGLVRFDGVQFTRFGLRDGLSSLFIKALLEDREGGLWIGTVNGLSRFQNGKLTTWTTRDGLAGNVILALDEDAEGAVWIATNTGLSRWRRDAFEVMGGDEDIASRYVATLAADREGSVWVSVTGLGLLRWDGTAFARVTNVPPAVSGNPSRLIRDRSGRIWAGTPGNVSCFDGVAWKTYGADEGLPRVSITSLGVGADGRIWAGTIDEGLFYLGGGKFHRVSQADGLSDTAIMAVAEDRERNVWVGTRAGGLNRLKARQVFVWCHMEEEVEVPPMSLAESADGTLWVAAQGRGIYRLNTCGNTWSAGEPIAGPLPYGAILTARDGSLWLGAGWRLLQWQDGALVKSYSNATELRGDSVRCLWEDRESGMWLATRDGRLLLLRDGSFTTFTNGLPRDMMTALAQQRDGTVWIGSYGGGLGRLQNGVGTTFRREHGLASELVRVLYLDSREHLWIGTEGGGLNVFRNGILRSFGPQHGMGDDTMVQILEDNDGDLWLGTYRGIYRIRWADMNGLLTGRLARVHPRAFDQSDGLLSAQCTTGFGAALKLRDGRLLFSTDRGLVVIDPQRLIDDTDPPIVRLERLLVGGRLWPDELCGATGPNGTVSATLEIPPGNQRFEFYYTALSFAAPERVRFRYRLAGFDADWVEAGAQRIAPFSYLPPGRYRFEVAAHTGNGRWSDPGAALQLVVLPHYWETWWFRVTGWLGGVSLATAGVVVVLRRRHKARMEIIEHQRAVERERARIAQDMHDELGSRLTQAGMVARDLDAPPAGPRLDILRRTLDEMTVTMDELVWAVNPRHDTLDGLANYMLRFAQEFFAGTRIRCELNIPPNLPAAPLTAAIRHNLFLAFKESLNNAAKHAHPTTIRVRVQFAAGELRVEVKDDGAGFDPADPRTRGRGLEIMRNRLQTAGGRCEIESHPGRGTRVRFEVPLRI